MSWFEYILLVLGISLDIFAAMEIQGAMLANVRKRALLVACSIVTVLQLAFYCGGYLICYLLESGGIVPKADNLGEVIAVIIYAGLGIRLLVKAFKREFIPEVRRANGLKAEEYIMMITITTCYTLAAGCASGFAGADIWYMVVAIICCSIIVVICGLYSGLHFGFQNKTVVYVCGAVLLWAAGADVLLSDIMKLYSF